MRLIYLIRRKHDLYTFFIHSGNSSSIIYLIFANSKIENAITNWSIDENAVTGSFHEVIRFELNASFKLDVTRNRIYRINTTAIKPIGINSQSF